MATERERQTINREASPKRERREGQGGKGEERRSARGERSRAEGEGRRNKGDGRRENGKGAEGGRRKAQGCKEKCERRTRERRKQKWPTEKTREATSGGNVKRPKGNRFFQRKQNYEKRTNTAYDTPKTSTSPLPSTIDTTVSITYWGHATK